MYVYNAWREGADRANVPTTTDPLFHRDPTRTPPPLPQLFNSLGLHIDASSGYEIDRAIRAGVPASHISLSSQVRTRCVLTYRKIYVPGDLIQPTN